MGILLCHIASARVGFPVDGEQQAHAPRRWAKAYHTHGVSLVASRAQKKKACMLTGSSISEEVLTSATFSIHENN